MTYDNRKQALWLARGEALGRWLRDKTTRMSRTLARRRSAARAPHWTHPVAGRSNRG